MKENNNIKLVEFSKDYTKEVSEIIADAATEEFTAVIIFGYKDRKIYVRVSASKSTLEIIGAMEAAKQELWDSM